jgi:hypothetical protein
MKAISALQLFMWLICAFHILVGLSLNVPLIPLDVIARYYGASVEWTPQFVYILKPLGAFMFILGGLAAAAALKPLHHKAIVYGFVALFALRALQRLIFQQEVQAAFSIPSSRNLGAMVLFFALAAGLFVVCRAAEKRQALG